MKMAAVYLGIGTNLGERLKNTRAAINKLSALGEVKATSSVWETEPWGYKNQPRFLNCALLLETKISPSELLDKIQHIEKQLGRKRGPKFGPRLIDIDILFYNFLILNEPNLTIPHPKLLQRKFILAPLAEIAPNLNHPVLHKSINDLLRDLKDSGEYCKIFTKA